MYASLPTDNLEIPVHSYSDTKLQPETRLCHNVTCHVEERNCSFLHFAPLLHSCASEMEHWLEDLRMAVDLAEQSSGSHADLLSPADNSESAVFKVLSCLSAEKSRL